MRRADGRRQRNGAHQGGKRERWEIGGEVVVAQALELFGSLWSGAGCLDETKLLKPGCVCPRGAACGGEIALGGGGLAPLQREQAQVKARLNRQRASLRREGNHMRPIGGGLREIAHIFSPTGETSPREGTTKRRGMIPHGKRARWTSIHAKR